MIRWVLDDLDFKWAERAFLVSIAIVLLGAVLGSRPVALVGCGLIALVFFGPFLLLALDRR